MTERDHAGAAPVSVVTTIALKPHPMIPVHDHDWEGGYYLGTVPANTWDDAAAVWADLYCDRAAGFQADGGYERGVRLVRRSGPAGLYQSMTATKEGWERLIAAHPANREGWGQLFDISVARGLFDESLVLLGDLRLDEDAAAFGEDLTGGIRLWFDASSGRIVLHMVNLGAPPTPDWVPATRIFDDIDLVLDAARQMLGERAWSLTEDGEAMAISLMALAGEDEAKRADLVAATASARCVFAQSYLLDEYKAAAIRDSYAEARPGGVCAPER